MRVLLIEDDSATAQSVELMLKAEGMTVYTTDLGEEGVDLARQYDYDLILLDLGLPDMSGFDVLRQIRAAKIAAPVIIITGAKIIETEVKSFSLGADDFLGKPFHRDVLIQRIRAVVRRARGHATATVEVGPIVVDLDAKRVRVDGRLIHLTGQEYKVVELLSIRKGVTLTKDVFLNHLYGGMDEPELKIIDVFVCKIRKKFGSAGANIETVWGRGYRMVASIDDRETPIRPKSGREPQTMGSRVLARLGRGQASFAELWALEPRWVENSLRGVLTTLMAEGLIWNAGGHRAALYKLAERAAA